MKFVDEYRDAEAVQAIAKSIRATKPWTIMEVCGGQTHAIVKYGLDELLPPEVELVHGPGCPVCVTPVETIDHAIAIAARPDVILCTFGDMLRVPGTRGSLFAARAEGADVRMVYSPLDALQLARQTPAKEVVFLAVGFETTAPANAMALVLAKREGVRNFSMLASHVLVPPAMEALLSAPDNRVQGFLAAGHVCTVMGYREYEPLAKKFRVPIVVTGFEPLDILEGVRLCVRQLEEGRTEVENQYVRSVRPDGNAEARHAIEEVYRVVPRRWRGMGEIPRSGLGISEAYADFDAEVRLRVTLPESVESGECISGLILKGVKKPRECPAFGTRCTPESPLGPTMVSSEGACAAYHRYRKA